MNSLLLQSFQTITCFLVHLFKVILRQNLDQLWQLFLEFGDPAVPNLDWPVLLIIPEGRWSEFVQTSRHIVAITTEAVESLPVFPPWFP